MEQHDHEHMPKQQPSGADDQPNKDEAAADQAHTHGQHTQPAPGDGHAAAGDGAHQGGHAAGSSAAAQQPAAPAGDGQSRHAGMGHGGMGQMAMTTNIPLAYRPTRAQIAAVSLLSVLALSAALIFSASYTNLRLSARDVGGAIMPPGMIMTYDTPGQSMRDMAAIDPRTVSYTAPADARGDQMLEPRIENGVKVFDGTVNLTIPWNVWYHRRHDNNI